MTRICANPHQLVTLMYLILSGLFNFHPFVFQPLLCFLYPTKNRATENEGN